jgi:hypothetical protein
MICPFANVRLLPESAQQPAITPRAVILHSAAGRGSLYGFFLNSSKLESHFWVSTTGLIEQYIDTGVRADANLDANGFAISIETESSVMATERWTEAQAAALVRLCTWLCDTHKIPKRQIDTPTGAGIGWHILFGAPGPWTPVAKSCPGPARVIQARDEIIPAVRRTDDGDPYKPPAQKGFLMALSEKQQDELYLWTKAIHRELTSSADTTSPKGATVLWRLRKIGDAVKAWPKGT